MLVIICIWKIKLSVGVYKTRLIGFIDPAIIEINIIFPSNLMEAAVILERRFPRCGAIADPPRTHLPQRVILGTVQLGNEYKCFDRFVLSTTLTFITISSERCSSAR